MHFSSIHNPFFPASVRVPQVFHARSCPLYRKYASPHTSRLPVVDLLPLSARKQHKRERKPFLTSPLIFSSLTLSRWILSEYFTLILSSFISKPSQITTSHLTHHHFTPHSSHCYLLCLISYTFFSHPSSSTSFSHQQPHFPITNLINLIFPTPTRSLLAQPPHIHLKRGWLMLT